MSHLYGWYMDGRMLGCKRAGGQASKKGRQTLAAGAITFDDDRGDWNRGTVLHPADPESSPVLNGGTTEGWKDSL